MKEASKRIYFDILFEEDGLKKPNIKILQEKNPSNMTGEEATQRNQATAEAREAIAKIKQKYDAELSKLEMGLKANPGDKNLLARKQTVMTARQHELNNIAKETAFKMSNIERNVYGATTSRTAQTHSMLSGEEMRPGEKSKAFEKAIAGHKVGTKLRGKSIPIDWSKYKTMGKKYGIPLMGLYAAWRMTRPSPQQSYEED